MDDLSADAQIFTFHKTNHAVEDTEGINMAVDMGHLHTHGQGVGDYHSAVDSRGLNTGPGGGGWARGLKNTHTPDFARLTHDDSYTSDAESEAVVKKMSQYGSQTESTGTSQEVLDALAEENLAKPQRIFKVVFVGDSGVGKSSFIHRFCKNQFKANFSATIGVDFQVKELEVGDCIVVLQLWDTAGQERFRSVTKQYFRKADGVIVMYDVTSEQSFLNVRQWMDSVQDGVEEGTVLTVIGNKTDLVEADPDHVTKVKDGSKLAVEYDALFYETSAKSGSYITEAMLGMASLLKDKEDKAIEASLKLTDPPRKKGCCS